MTTDRVTVQNLLDLSERGRQTTEKVSEAVVENAVAMEKVASAVTSLERKLDEKLSDKADKRERFLFRTIGALIVVVCFFAGVKVYEAFERSDAKASRISAPIDPPPSPYEILPPPD